MTVQRHKTKSCCGSAALLFETEKPVRKNHAQMFKDAGYLVPDNWYQLGFFWVKKGNMVATASYGSSKIQVRCAGEQCTDLLNEFEALLDRIAAPQPLPAPVPPPPVKDE